MHPGLDARNRVGQTRSTPMQNRTTVPSGNPSLQPLGLVITALACAASVNADGFRLSPPGTFNLGRAGGRIAQVDDASAVVQNPANMMDLPAAEIAFSPTIIYASVQYDSPLGNSLQTHDGWNFLPNFFATLPLKDNVVTAGLGITVPYGLAVNWDNDKLTPLHYTTPFLSEMKTLNFSPSLAVRLCDTLTLGAGLDVMWSQVTLKQNYPWFLLIPGTLEGTAKSKGTGTGVGANAGITWEFLPKQRLALTIRTPMNVDYSGTFTIDNQPLPTYALGVTPSTSFNTGIRFPTIISAGYGVQITDKIRLETDFEWLQFSRFKSLDVDMANDNVLFPNRSNRMDWKNSFTAGFGGDWRFAPNWVLRGGYQYYCTPIPDYTYTPAIPDANEHVLTVGLGYRYKKSSFEVAYGMPFFRNRNISNNQNPAYLGKYQEDVQLISFQYQFTF